MPNNQKISILDKAHIAKRDLNKREVINNYAGGGSRFNGFSDPNPDFSPYDLFGISGKTAIYEEMAKASPVIAQALRKIADSISNMSVDITPTGTSIEHILAAEYCKEVLTNMGRQSLKAWIWEVVYHTCTNGHSLFEIVIEEETDKLNLFRVRSNTVQSFNSNDEGYYTGAQVTTHGSSIFLPVEKSILITMEDYPGNWWGISMLRPLVATYQMYKTSIINFLAGQRNNKGLLYLKETGETTNESWMAVQSFLSDYYNDKDSPLILDRNIDIDFLSTVNPAGAEIKDLYDKYESTIREYLFDSLNNLGQHGSRALGSEYRTADAQAFAQFVSTWEDLLNGRSGDHGNLLLRICEYSGFEDPRSICPVFQISDNSEQDIDAQVSSIKTLVDSGLVTKEDLGDATIAKIIRQIGYEPYGLLERIKLEEGNLDKVEGVSRFSEVLDKFLTEE